jgi:glycosyltransferase involved in cell wall biosynthesis
MRAAYVTSFDSNDVSHWSGLGYYLGRALEAQGIELVRIGPLRRYLDPIIVGKFLFHKALHSKYQRQRAPQVLRSYARQVASQLKGHDVDFIFSPGMLELAYFETSLPVIHWTDCCFGGMVDFYPNMTNLAAETFRDGDAAERAGLAKCRLVMFSSQWAAQTAFQHYQVDPAKVKIVPFGANMTFHLTMEEIPRLLAARKQDPLRLLFVGVEWERKGGDLAVALVDNLVRNKVPVEMTIVGCEPPASARRRQIICRGFLSKNVPAELVQVEKLFSESHFLVMPSRAECSAIVVPEANSFAVPSLVSDVGGFPELIQQGQSGFCFPLSTFVEDATRQLLRIREEKGAYEKMAYAAFTESSQRLNWDKAGQMARKLIEEALDR